MTTGEKIALLRKEAGLSQEALADKLGISRQAVSKWEADQAVPTMDNLMELSRIFTVQVDTLLRPDSPLPEKGQETSQAAGDGQEDIASSKLFSGRKTKYFVWGISALLGVSMVWNIIFFVWMNRLQEQVNNIPVNGGGTIYVPTPSSVDTEKDLADVFIDYELVEKRTDIIRLLLRATPYETNINEIAHFNIRNNDRNTVIQSVEAVYENGYYTGEAILSTNEGNISIYLLVENNDRTRFFLITQISDLASMFTIEINPYFNKNFNMGWSSVTGGFAYGTMYIDISAPDSTLSNEIYPVAGCVILWVDGEEYDSVPITEIEERISEWTKPENKDFAHTSSTYSVELPWTSLPVPSSSELRLSIEVTDNLNFTRSMNL